MSARHPEVRQGGRSPDQHLAFSDDSFRAVEEPQDLLRLAWVRDGVEVAVDHLAIRLQQQRDGVVRDEPEQDAVGQPQSFLDTSEAVLESAPASGHLHEGPQDRGDPEEQAHEVADDDADVAIEHRDGRDHEREAQHEDVLHDRDQRHPHDLPGDVVVVGEEPHHDEHQQAEQEADDLRERVGHRQDDLGEEDLLDQPFLARDRVGGAADRSREPLERNHR